MRNQAINLISEEGPIGQEIIRIRKFKTENMEVVEVKP